MNNISTQFSKHFHRMIQETLKEGYKLEEPVSSAGILDLQKKAKAILKTTLPSSFCDFLRLMNGHIDFGCMLFGAEQRIGVNGGWIFGVLEFNTDIFLQYPDLIVLGKSGDDYLVYDSSESYYKFKNLDSTANNLNEQFTNFSDLIDDIIIPLMVIEGDEDV